MIPEHAEEEWFALLQQGEETALHYFFQVYSPAVRGYVAAMVNDETVAEEIISSAFFKLWEGRLTLKSPGHLVNFLYKVAEREALDYLRRQKILSAKQQRWLVLQEKEELDDGLSLKDTEQLKAIVLHEVYQRAEQLSPACKKVFDLRYVKGKEVGEIAEQLALRPQTVYNQLTKAIGLLRKTLQEKKLLE
ncbi:MAG TPA: sigma-70 family RNA polymerase sigma factor [Puia sp.]|jgi:RNA polymerase sigma-70 factor (ECF subfamily)|nr:sigma-70 family RNA polymerase sigma factor [Puia sp.]